MNGLKALDTIMSTPSKSMVRTWYGSKVTITKAIGSRLKVIEDIGDTYTNSHIYTYDTILQVLKCENDAGLPEFEDWQVE